VCNEGQLETVTNGKKTTVSGFEVILEDTIFFPEGGGQVYSYFIFVCHSALFLVQQFNCGTNIFHLFKNVILFISKKPSQ
jgi:alanyl-tRNA synthetase